MVIEQIQVLVVDDSSFRRRMLSAVLNDDPEIRVIGEATNGQDAYNKAKALHPDVITMDIQMPVMNGFEAIEAIMGEIPTPIIVTSAVNAQTLGKALTVGAMDFVTLGQNPDAIAQELIEKVKIASRVTPIRRISLPQNKPICTMGPMDSFRVVAIGVSTGGPSVLAQLFSSLPVDLPAAILVVQHMMRGFTEGLVQHLQTENPFDIQLAAQGQRLHSGTAWIAPDHHHLRLGHDGAMELLDDQEVKSAYQPSVDVMMTSVAKTYQHQAMGVILTGMGDDGVYGMQAIKEAGGITVAQDQASSVIFGMNRLAIESGCVDQVVPACDIASVIAEFCRKRTPARCSL